jgi:hypothetical protein
MDLEAAELIHPSSREPENDSGGYDVEARKRPGEGQCQAGEFEGLVRPEEGWVHPVSVGRPRGSRAWFTGLQSQIDQAHRRPRDVRLDQSKSRGKIPA